MSEQRLRGKRVLVTQSEDYMGPATLETVCGAWGRADRRQQRPLPRGLR